MSAKDSQTPLKNSRFKILLKARNMSEKMLNSFATDLFVNFMPITCNTFHCFIQETLEKKKDYIGLFGENFSKKGVNWGLFINE